MTEIHSRIARAQFAAYEDLFRAAPPVLRRRLGLWAGDVGGALMFESRGVPSVLLNRVLGLGVLREASRADVRAVAERVSKHPGRPCFIVAGETAQPASLRQWLLEEGFARYPRAWVTMLRERGPVPDVPTELGVARLSERHAAAFGQLVARGFDLPEMAGKLLCGVVSRSGWHAFGAFDGAVLVGAAALHVDRDVGYLAFAVTDPAHRGRGAQGALMARRLQVADALGCCFVFSETGEPAPGDPQHSQHNMVRTGFRPIGLQHNYALPGLELTRSARSHQEMAPGVVSEVTRATP